MHIYTSFANIITNFCKVSDFYSYLKKNLHIYFV